MRTEGACKGACGRLLVRLWDKTRHIRQSSRRMLILHKAAEAGVCCRLAIPTRDLPVPVKPAHDASAASAQRSIRVSLMDAKDV